MLVFAGGSAGLGTLRACRMNPDWDTAKWKWEKSGHHSPGPESPPVRVSGIASGGRAISVFSTADFQTPTIEAGSSAPVVAFVVASDFQRPGSAALFIDEAGQ